MGDKGELEFAATVEAGQAADYLARIADGLRQGAITLAVDKRAVHLQPAKYVRLELEVESNSEKARGSLQLEVSWKAKTAEESRAAKDLTIKPGPQPEIAAAQGSRSE